MRSERAAKPSGKCRGKSTLFFSATIDNGWNTSFLFLKGSK